MEAKAAKTLTWPTFRISAGTLRDANKKPRKYPDITTDISKVENPALSPRTPRRVPCRPFPTIKSITPKSKGQAVEITWITAFAF
jgi:hypothetical protein